jgi:hypothetical protein
MTKEQDDLARVDGQPCGAHWDLPRQVIQLVRTM